MKRTLLLFVALSALVLVLVGCGDTSALETENANLKAENEAMQAENEAMQAQNEAMQAQIEEGMAMLAAGTLPTGGEGSRLNTVKERGRVICASRDDVPGYGGIDADGNNVGFDIDLCRALATAVVGDPNAIEIRLISAAERGPTIQSGEVDMLVRTVTWTASRDAGWGNYAQTMFYDGQGFMVRADSGVTNALELEGATVCVTLGTTTELNLQDFSDQNGLGITVATFEDTDAVVAAYDAGQCDSFTNDNSQLAALRTALSNPADHVILPNTISEEPLGPVVPHGDDQWFDVVKTVMAILIYGEAYGVSQDNVPSAETGNTKVDRLLGLSGAFGQEELGLSQTVAQDVLNAVGNYGDIYDRNLGPSGINLPREGGRNALWANAPCTDCPKGGQIYAAPLR
ncbi:MAG: transporter substrate-binding domain-containing protein [Chloroflexi bacterium]|nr:transporter substrate-binding domain-containing protein [Chloroflexota bacterium]